MANPFQWLGERGGELAARMKTDATSNAEALEGMQRLERMRAYQAAKQGFIDRQSDNRNVVLAEFLNNRGGSEARQDAINRIMGTIGMAPKKANTIDGAGLKDVMAGLDEGQLAQIAGAYAGTQGGGPKQAVLGMAAGYNRAMADPGLLGQATRGATLGAAVGGGVMGVAAMTEGAQQLWQLIAYLRGGEQNEEAAANSPLNRA